MHRPRGRPTTPADHLAADTPSTKPVIRPPHVDTNRNSAKIATPPIELIHASRVRALCPHARDAAANERNVGAKCKGPEALIKICEARIAVIRLPDFDVHQLNADQISNEIGIAVRVT